MQVMDTPGLFDTKQSNDEIGVVIVKMIIDMHPGPNAILYVIRLGVRYTDEEYGAYKRFKLLFGSTVTKHMIILFTGGDTIQKKGKSIEQTLQNAPEVLKKVLEECSGRYVVFNNEASTSEKHSQVQKLLQLVQSLKERNGEKPYVCASYSAIGDSLEEVETLKKEVRRKMREVEDEEVRLTELFQEQERQLRKKLQQLDLSEAQHEKEIATLKTQMKNERIIMLEEWQKKKEEEEKALKARKEEQERQLRMKKEEQERQLQKEKERQTRLHQEKEKLLKLRQQKEKEDQDNLLQQKDRERQRKLKEKMDEEKKKLQREEEEHKRRLALMEREMREAHAREAVLDFGRLVFGLGELCLRAYVASKFP